MGGYCYGLYDGRTHVMGKKHINGIDVFWSRAKRVRQKHNEHCNGHDQALTSLSSRHGFRFSWGCSKNQFKMVKYGSEMQPDLRQPPLFLVF